MQYNIVRLCIIFNTLYTVYDGLIETDSKIRIQYLLSFFQFVLLFM